MLQLTQVSRGINGTQVYNAAQLRVNVGVRAFIFKGPWSAFML